MVLKRVFIWAKHIILFAYFVIILVNDENNASSILFLPIYYIYLTPLNNFL